MPQQPVTSRTGTISVQTTEEDLTHAEDETLGDDDDLPPSRKLSV